MKKDVSKSIRVRARIHKVTERDVLRNSSTAQTTNHGMSAWFGKAIIMRDGGWVLTPGQLNQNLSEYLRMLRRRMSAIVATIVVIMALVVGFILLAPPRYTASSQIVFDSKVAADRIDLRPVLSGQPPDEAFILSELDVIRARSLAMRVINKLRLDENPDFNKSLRADNSFSELIKRHLPETWWRMWKERPTDPEKHRERLVTEFQRSVSVTRNNRSRTVNVSFTADTPKLAAHILNTLTELYLVARMDDRLENAKRASAWLTEQIQDLRDKAEQADKAVENYRATNNLFEASRETLISREIGELNSHLTDASIERRAAEANLIQVRRLLNGAGTIDATPPVMQSELIRRYREEELGLERREAQMTQEYGNRHPALIQLRAEKQRLEEKIRTEITRIALSLENQAKMARDRENSIQANLQNVKSTMAKANAASVGLRALERQADASKMLLQQMMGTLLQTSAEENAKSVAPDARLISSAPVPENPSFPPKLLLLLSGLLASTFIGVLLAFVLEHLDSGFRSSEQVEACGLPVLAQVPIVTDRKVRPSAYVLEQPSSAYAAAIHAIYTRILADLRPAAAESAAVHLGRTKRGQIDDIALGCAAAGTERPSRGPGRGRLSSAFHSAHGRSRLCSRSDRGACWGGQAGRGRPVRHLFERSPLRRRGSADYALRQTDWGYRAGSRRASGHL